MVPSPNFPFIIFLKNLTIAAFFYVFIPPAPFFLFSFPFIMIKNSLNSIFPSSSTASIIFLTSSLDSAIPREIKGPSNSSRPIPPEPSSSNDLKYFFNSYLSLSSKSIKCFFPLSLNHFLSNYSWSYLFYSKHFSFFSILSANNSSYVTFLRTSDCYTRSLILKFEKSESLSLSLSLSLSELPSKLPCDTDISLNSSSTSYYCY